MRKHIREQVLILTAILLAVFSIVIIIVLPRLFEIELESLILSVGLIALAIYIVVAILAITLTKTYTNSLIKPYEIIRKKVQGVLRPEDDRVRLTKYDEINTILAEIDGVRHTFDKNLSKYQTEKEKLSFILENVNQGIMGLNGAKEVTLCNKAAREYFDFWADLPIYVNKIRAGKAFYDAAVSSMSQSLPITLEIKKGAMILEIRLIPKRSKEVSLIVVIEDVTAVRKLAKEKESFFENAGHELKTPLSSILGYSEMMMSSNQQNPNFVQTINKEAKRMDALIADMLKISSLESNKDIADQPLNLKEIIDDVIVSYAPMAEKKKVKLTSHLENCVVFAQSKKMSELASNLIDNAIKYTKADGRVEVGLICDAQFAIFSVTDNGIGIPEKYQSRVFERFFRAEKGRCRSSEGGTGLGLAIVKHICSHYRAQLLLESTQGIGTKFTIKLKLFKPSVSADKT